MTSRADQHDLDKLDRWRRSLLVSTGDFPVHAVFLVSESDLGVHDVFREFRRSFEAHNAGFEDLVIFGQHGISQTVHALQAGLGLGATPLPVLVLLTKLGSPQVYCLELPAGDGQATAMTVAATVLSRLEQGVRGKEEELRLGDISALAELPRLDEGLSDLVKRLLESL